MIYKIEYSNYEAGVRNLRKLLDRIFRKIVAKIEIKSKKEEKNESKENVEKKIIYKVTERNVEKIVDIAEGDLNYYYEGMTKELPIGSTSGLIYLNEGYG